jgi:mRNA interferase RelE/StbE
VRVRFNEGFTKDLGRIRDRGLLASVRRAIETVENARSLEELPDLKKLRGWARFYRIRVREYRLGLSIEGGQVTFMRFLHRKDIYRYFP